MWREWLGGAAVVGAFVCVMWAVIAVAARIAKRAIAWADQRDRAEQDERIEAERRRIAAMREAAVRAYRSQ